MFRQSFALLAFVFAAASITYLMIWISNFCDANPALQAVFQSCIDGPPVVDFRLRGPTAALFNLVLLGIFALQHNVMARLGIKARMRAAGVPFAWERSIYVACAAAAVALVICMWQPLPQPVWRVPPPYDKAVMLGGTLGGAMPFLSVASTGAGELVGLRQAFIGLDEQHYPRPEFVLGGLYQHVRHPMYLGMLVFLFCTPAMSAGRLLFASFILAFVLWSIPMEEADLVASLGERYERYRRAVPALVPRLRPYRGGAAAVAGPGKTAARAEAAAAGVVVGEGSGGGGGKKGD